MRRDKMETVDVDEFLRDRGVSEGEIADAEANGLLAVLVLDKLVFAGSAHFDEAKLVGEVGVEPDVARQLWRAMGFPTVPPGEVAFYDDDLEALAGAVLPDPNAPVEPMVRQTRVMSAAMARIAERITDDVEDTFADLRASGHSDREIAAYAIAVFDTDSLEGLLWYLFRRQFRASVWRRLARPEANGGTPATVVGFVDLVRFAAITEQVADDELERLIDRFEEVAHDAVTEGGGRIIKMIGDAVMYVADDPVHAVAVALDLVDAYADDELVPPARAGLAYGTALGREGDYYGPVVNLASRIVDIARPSKVVISDDLHTAISEAAEFSFRRLPPKRLKGIGHPHLWSVDRR
jgi:adenylate cyclase